MVIIENDKISDISVKYNIPLDKACTVYHVLELATDKNILDLEEKGCYAAGYFEDILMWILNISNKDAEKLIRNYK